MRHQFLLPLDCHIDLKRLGQTFLRDLSITVLISDQNSLNNHYNYGNDDQRMENEENAEDDVLLLEADGKNGNVINFT